MFFKKSMITHTLLIFIQKIIYAIRDLYTVITGRTLLIHFAVVSLARKFDKRNNTEKYTISKKQYINDKIHLLELQDKYHKRLTNKVYDVELDYYK